MDDKEAEQIKRSNDTAGELVTDDEGRFNERLKKLVKEKPKDDEAFD